MESKQIISNNIMSSTGIVKRKSTSSALVKSTNDKPPHSYIALIATAILKSPEKRLTLSEINDYLIKHYTFFQGPYKGWRNSVRHNLSYNKCFTKILKDPSRPWGKDNYWTISSLNDYLQEDGSFRRRRRRRPKGVKDTTIVKQERLEFTLPSDEDESSSDAADKLTTARESQSGSPEATRPVLPSTTFNSSFSISTILGEKLEPKRQERNEQMFTQGTVCQNNEYRPPVYAMNNLLATQSFFASAPYYTSSQRNLHWFLALGGSFNSTHA